MSSNQFQYTATNLPDASEMRIGIVAAEWNEHITGQLVDGAVKTLIENGVKPNNINVRHVPGSYELIYGAAALCKSRLFDAVIVIGCVIRGDTPHFDYICEGVTQGIARLNANGSIPVIFGLLTTNNEQQAKDRSGGSLGNKGNEFALTAIKMIDFAWQLQK